MKPTTRVVVAGLLALGAALGTFAARPWVIERLELSLLDWRFRVRGPVPTTGRISIVAIDEPSIDELGRWPWSRTVMARLIDRLTEAEVEAIGFDVTFSEPETAPAEGPAPDALLAAALARSERAVLGYFFRTGEEERADPEALKRALPLIRKSQVSVARFPAGATAPILTCQGVEPNLESFQAGAARLGFFNALRDPDGVVRRAATIARCGDALYVSLSLALLEKVTGERAMVLGDQEGIREIRLGRVTVPTDEGGKILVNYRGPAGTFPHFSAADVIAGRVSSDDLRGRIVLIGATEVAIGDVQSTPFGRAFPGIEVHATVLDNLLDGTVLRRDDRFTFVELGTLIVCGLLIALIVPRLRTVTRGALLAGSLFAIVAGAGFYAFVEAGLWFNLSYPALGILAVYGTVAITHSVAIEARSRRIRRNFATYVPPEVVHEMVENPDSFRLGGERRDLSILFSDVRDFTTLAEEIGAEEVSALLNEYLTPMTRIIFESRGTLDKYIGDAIVAFWGAPLAVEGHPQKVAEAALAMQEEIVRLRATQPDLVGVDRLRVGIGIHSAEVVVGNMGSELRFDYTITGDGVNLCSRLEGLTKHYGVGVIASHELLSRTQGVLARELDTIRVKGKRSSVRIFELLGRDDGVPPAHLEAYAEGLRLYRQGRWSDAERPLRTALAARGGEDTASLVLLERIARFRREPPADWDGVWTFSTK
ncbi:MAG: adenylate/guanylate cyclase domain-containing protein [Myxococcota bacterium]